MTSNQVLVAIGVLVGVLVVWGNILKQREADLSQHLDDLQTVQEEQQAVKKRLELDIGEIQSLQAEMLDDEIELDGKFATLRETLENIQTKLHGVEELSRAVQELEHEFSELNSQIRAYQDERRNFQAIE